MQLVSSSLPQNRDVTHAAVLARSSDLFCRSVMAAETELTTCANASPCVCRCGISSGGDFPSETTKLCSAASVCLRVPNRGPWRQSARISKGSARNPSSGPKTTRLQRREHLTALIFSLLILTGFLGGMTKASSIRTCYSLSTECFTHTIVHNICYRLIHRKSRYKAIWYDFRLEEKRDCIYRLPPPGNGRQARIYEFFRSSNPIIQGNSIHLLPKTRTRDNHAILQWNAQSLDEEKALELSHFAKHYQATALLISELGHRRTIPGFKPVVSDDRFRQSGIFIPTSFEARIVDCSLLEHDRIAIEAAIYIYLFQFTPVTAPGRRLGLGG